MNTLIFESAATSSLSSTVKAALSSLKEYEQPVRILAVKIDGVVKVRIQTKNSPQMKFADLMDC